MGYQDGTGLRAGRSRGKQSGEMAPTSDLTTARAGGASGYRAAGAVSPVQIPKALWPSSNSLSGAAALGQFKLPEPPGLGQQLAAGVGAKLAEKGVSAAADYLFNSSSVPSSALDAANATSDSIGALADSQGWYDVAGAGADAAASAGADAAASAGADAGGDFFSSVGDFFSGGFADGGRVPGHTVGLDPFSIDVDGGEYVIPTDVVDRLGVGYFDQLVAQHHTPVAATGAVGGDCFITEATMAGLGVQDDNAEPLRVLRAFRDNVLAGTPQGQAMIEGYEAIAPLVVEAVEMRPDALEVFKQLYAQFIAPSVEAVKASNFPLALQIYAAMIAAVTPLAQEVAGAYGGEEAQEPMQQLSMHSAQVAQSPQVAQQATMPGMQGGGALSQFSASPVRFGRS